MSYPNAIEVCRAELFTKEVELRERYPQALVDKVLRVREMYNWFIANPDGTDREFVAEVCQRHGIHRTTAYSDLAVVKSLLPMLGSASRDFHRWRTKERIRALNARGEQVPPYLKGYLRRLDRDLNKMRSVAVYYREYSSIENLQLLGENYIKQMKRDLTPLTFQTSILCQRIGIAKDGFYSSMREGHKYDANDNQYLDTLGYDYDFSTLDARTDKDVDPDAPICIDMDYNANINWIVAGQPRDRRLNVIKSFYVKFERKIPALVEDFCRYYAEHRNKTVVYYYDATALGSNYAVNEQDYRWWVVHEFKRRGWQVEAVYLGNPMRHDEKYLLINQDFAGKQRLVPFFNRSNNEDLILAIQSAGVSRGRNGFRKDKSGEKLAESEEDLLEHRTDGTDDFDTLYIGCEKFPYHDSFSLSMSGVI